MSSDTTETQSSASNWLDPIDVANAELAWCRPRLDSRRTDRQTWIRGNVTSSTIGCAKELGAKRHRELQVSSLCRRNHLAQLKLSLGSVASDPGR